MGNAIRRLHILAAMVTGTFGSVWTSAAGPRSAVVGAAGSSSSRRLEIAGKESTSVGHNRYYNFDTLTISPRESLTLLNAESSKKSGGTTRIFVRVIGPGPASINGPLISDFPNANVYLLDPHGITFGPKARLLMPKSFVAATSNYVQFGRGVQLWYKPHPRVLSWLPPSAMGFTFAPESTAGAIVVDDTARLILGQGDPVSEVGNVLTFVSRTITLREDSRISVAFGQINLLGGTPAAVGKNGLVTLAADGVNPAPPLPRSSGQVTVDGSSVLDVGGSGLVTIEAKADGFMGTIEGDALIDVVGFGGHGGTITGRILGEVLRDSVTPNPPQGMQSPNPPQGLGQGDELEAVPVEVLAAPRVVYLKKRSRIAVRTGSTSPPSGASLDAERPLELGTDEEGRAVIRSAPRLAQESPEHLRTSRVDVYSEK